MYHLGIDLGTTWTAAAVCRADARGPEPVPLGEHGHAVASVVYAGPDGSFLLGEAAERRARSAAIALRLSAASPSAPRRG